MREDPPREDVLSQKKEPLNGISEVIEPLLVKGSRNTKTKTGLNLQRVFFL